MRGGAKIEEKLTQMLVLPDQKSSPRSLACQRWPLTACYTRSCSIYCAHYIMYLVDYVIIEYHRHACWIWLDLAV